MQSEVFYVLIKRSESWEWTREDIITGSRIKDLVDDLCEKFEATVDYELSKRDWLCGIDYRVEKIRGIYVDAQANQIFKDFMEDLE